VTTSLPDVNVLLAVAAAGHIHHVSARQWFEGRKNDSVVICRVTQMGLLRLLTNKKVVPSGGYSIKRAWDFSDELLADKRVIFEAEPPELESGWKARMKEAYAGSSSWTDAYLAAFARCFDYEMVTFDRGFRRWTDLALVVLVQSAE
jgi:toxin-antitoxin system PIN domain toxin